MTRKKPVIGLTPTRKKERERKPRSKPETRPILLKKRPKSIKLMVEVASTTVQINLNGTPTKEATPNNKVDLKACGIPTKMEDLRVIILSNNKEAGILNNNNNSQEDGIKEVVDSHRLST